jgi:hypothetical protein
LTPAFREPGSNRWSRASAATPGPSSATLTTIAPSRAAARQDHARARVAAGVVEQRCDDSLDDLGVDAGHHRRRRALNLECEVALGQRRGPALGDVVEHAAELAAARLDLRLGARGGHQRLEDAAHLLGAALDHRVGLAAVLWRTLAALQQLDLGHDPRQRRAQFVRELSRQPLFVAQARRDPIQERVERARQVAPGRL